MFVSNLGLESVILTAMNSLFSRVPKRKIELAAGLVPASSDVLSSLHHPDRLVALF